MDLLRLSQFPVVAAGSKATLVTDELAGRSLLALIFEQGGTFTKAQMTEIRLRLDGKDLTEGLSGQQHQDLNNYNGLPDVANYVMVPFGDPTARTIRGQWLGAIDLSVYRAPLEIEIDVDAAATSPTLQAYALVGPPKLAMGIGFSEAEAAIIRALIRTVIQPAGAVTKKSYQIGLGSEAGARLRQLAFFHSALTSVEFKKGGFVKHDDIATALNSAVAQQFARVPQSGLYVLDRIIDANQGEAETTLKQDGTAWPFQVNLTTSGADTITSVADVHTALPLL